MAENTHTHTFIAYGSLKRQIIIGHDFQIRNRMTLGWNDDENNKPIKVLKDQFKTIAKMPEYSKKNIL